MRCWPGLGVRCKGPKADHRLHGTNLSRRHLLSASLLPDQGTTIGSREHGSQFTRNPAENLCACALHNQWPLVWAWGDKDADWMT